MIDEKDSEAKSVPEETDDFAFELPPVSKKEDDFVDDFVQQESEQYTQDESVSASQNKTEETADTARGLRSEKGEEFDPSQHVYPPKQTLGGKWRKKRKTQIESEEITSNVAYQVEAQKLAMLYAEAHRLPFGEGGAVKSKNDLIPLGDALQQYMSENGLKEIPPILQVLLTGLSYTSGVVQREENEEKVSKWKLRLTNGIGWIKAKFTGKKYKREEIKASSEKENDGKDKIKAPGLPTDMPAPTSENNN